ncbi:MAG: efflux RND transporter periplasmic adaptor subunit [Bacteroidales bacterium]|nr:efflux RND transporter periplasmic adaptor subunit [Bacteroidales bacterium]MCF8327476.1 efflux RND transporter periplasmic adaptor subunit [Bacteroidales bacterium]
MKKRRNLIIIGVVVLIVLLIIAKKQNWIGKPEAVKVSTEKIKKRDIIETVNANGKVQPETEVVITSDVSGEIIQLFVEEGQRVEKDDSLLRINPDIYQSTVDRQEASLNTSKANLANAKARLAQVKAQFKNAKNTFERSKKLFEQDVVSESEYEKAFSSFESAKADVQAAEQNVVAAEYSVKSAEASLKEARDNLRKTTVYAPMSGVVSRLEKEVGERISGASQFSAGTEVMRIADLENMEVKVDVSENNIVLVELNDTADIDVDAYPDRRFKGIVSEMANSANQSGGSSDQVTNFEVKIKMLRSSYDDLIDTSEVQRFPFRPGMSANVDIRTEQVSGVVAVPIQAVIAREDNKKKKDEKTTEQVYTKYVFQYKDEKALLTEVKTGIQDDRYIEIKSGIQPEEEVIVAPYQAITETLKDSMLVNKVDRSQLMIFEK